MKGSRVLGSRKGGAAGARAAGVNESLGSPWRGFAASRWSTRRRPWCHERARGKIDATATGETDARIRPADPSAALSNPDMVGACEITGKSIFIIQLCLCPYYIILFLSFFLLPPIRSSSAEVKARLTGPIHQIFILDLTLKYYVIPFVFSFSLFVHEPMPLLLTIIVSPLAANTIGRSDMVLGHFI